MKQWMRRLATAGLSFVLAVAFFSASRIDAAELVVDINAGQAGLVTYTGDPGVDLAGSSLLPLQDSPHGMELWLTDYTPGGTHLLRDVFPGRAGSTPTPYRMLGNIAVFLAIDGIHGLELWRSDGTETGTFMLADIGPGPQHYGNSNAFPSALLNGVLYFAADDGVTGNELWRTDGTREGTFLLADIVPGYEGSDPTYLSSAANHIFFVRQREVWVSDGTTPGTRKIADINVSLCCKAAGNAVFFTANDEVHGLELWRADADGQNVRMVANLNTVAVGNGQDGSSDPEPEFTRGESLFFVAQTPLIPPTAGTANDCRFYRTDASGVGVTELANFHDRCGISKVINLPAGAMFSLSPAGNGDAAELWVTDGTPVGTMRLDLNGLAYSIATPSDHFKAAYGENGEAYFFGRLPGGFEPDKIWRTDGTRAGTHVYADLTTYSEQQEIAWLNGRVYFDTGGFGSDSAGDELWTSDGSVSGTFLVRNIMAGDLGSRITDLRVANSHLLFFATRTGGPRELWTSDGSSAGTLDLGTSDDGIVPPSDANVVFAEQLGSRVIYAADLGPEAHGRELSITDGTRTGTSLIRDINPGGSADPDSFLLLGNQMLFVAQDFDHGRELWRTDGTEAGTIQLQDIARFDGNIALGNSGSILNGIAYFTGSEVVSSPELWRTDGSVAGTFKVPGNVGQRVAILGGTGSRLLYQALSSGAMHLWSWNGSQASIVTAADGLKITADPGVTFEGRVCFRAWENDPRRADVWCASGVQGDLVRATNLGSLGLSAGDMRVLDNQLLVNALGSGAASGLYATHGVAAGMQRISEERIRSAKSFGVSQLVFLSEGGELMLTDGTTGGTRRLLQGVTLPGPASGAFGVLGSYVVLVVNDPGKGAVLWRTDGNVSGSRYLADLDPGTDPADAQSNAFFTLGDRLLYAGYRTGTGNQIWSISATDPNASDDSISATAASAVAVDVLDNDADFDGSLNAASVTVVTQPAHGTATVNATTGAITYTASATYSGADTLTYRVSDDQGHASNAATLSLQVTGGSGGDPPPPPPASGGSGGGGGALGLEILGLLLLTIRKGANPLRGRRLLRT
jgi:ELWxxDGT repeat protein